MDPINDNEDSEIPPGFNDRIAADIQAEQPDSSKKLKIIIGILSILLIILLILVFCFGFSKNNDDCKDQIKILTDKIASYQTENSELKTKNKDQIEQIEKLKENSAADQTKISDITMKYENCMSETGSPALVENNDLCDYTLLCKKSYTDLLSKNISNNNNNNQIKFKLLYKTNRNEYNDDYDNFHSKCDDKGPIVVVAKTQFGTIIGGYTNKNLNKMNEGFISDDSLSHFLFNLNTKKIYRQFDKEHAMHYNLVNDKHYLVEFGLGGDFTISNLSFDAAGNVGTAYGKKCGGHFCDEQIKEFTGGSVYGTAFNLLDLEVFQVINDENQID